MSRLVLKRATRSDGISLANKVEAIAAVVCDGKKAADVVAELYRRLERPEPKKPAAIMASWRVQIQGKLDAGDEKAHQLCKESELVRETNEEIPKPKARKKAKK